MILWCDGAHDVGENMRRDARLLDACEAHAARGERFEAVLRLFAFHPPGITLGHAQDPARVLDLERCREAGIAWAVRPTGGRAIFHADEWTYSLTAPIADPSGAESLRRTTTRRRLRCCCAQLVRLGVPAAFAPRRRRADARAPPRPLGRGVLRLDARHEIVLGGAKLVGSAAAPHRRALLRRGERAARHGPRAARRITGASRRRARGGARGCGSLTSPRTPAALLGPDPALERWPTRSWRSFPRLRAVSRVRPASAVDPRGSRFLYCPISLIP
jgi:lipoate-protein ligase A